MNRIGLLAWLALTVSAPAMAQDEIISKACKSHAPVLVYDNFSDERFRIPPVIDLNGDQVPDITHGEFVEKIVELYGHQTVRLNLGGNVVFSDIVESLTKVVNDLESGVTAYSRINFSQEVPLKISAFKTDLFADDSSVPEITADNLPLYKEKILRKLWTDRPDFQLEELNALFLRLEKLGVPFVVAAGNSGASYVNAFSLFPGVTTVGALNIGGAKRVLSADNALVKVWRVGTYVPRLRKGGLDIGADSEAEFSDTILSKDPKIVDLYRGKPVRDVVLNVSDEIREYAKRLSENEFVVPNAILNVIAPGLYRVSDLVTLGTVTKGTAKHFLSSGAFVYKAYGTGAPVFFFDESKGGTVVFDPLKTGTADQLIAISGTSFAAPALCNFLKQNSQPGPLMASAQN